jgi:hypothetical protein
MAGRSGDRIPVEEKFTTFAETGSEAHPASYKMGLFTESKTAGAWRRSFTTI